MMKYLFILLALLTTSCANYIGKMYDELDGVNRRQVEQKRANVDQTFDQYRQRNVRPVQQRLSSATNPNVAPSIKRKYNNEAPRVTVSNFHDNKNDGSLWAGNGNDNYLFTKNKWKRNGDIILVNVQTQLKNMITMELKRAFPPLPTLDAPRTAETTPAAQPAAKPATDEDEDKSVDTKVHDKISSVIIEEISRDHLLVRGQKNVLYKNRKHLVELQALISRKDINEDDTVDSIKFLESSVSVLR